MKKKTFILLTVILIVILAFVCIAVIVLCQGDGSPSAGNMTTGTAGTTNGSSAAGTEDEIDLDDLLNPDNGAQTPPATSNPEGADPDASADPELPDAAEDGNDGYSNGWY